jgi:hypothetical protein
VVAGCLESGEEGYSNEENIGKRVFEQTILHFTQTNRTGVVVYSAEWSSMERIVKIENSIIRFWQMHISFHKRKICRSISVTT